MRKLFIFILLLAPLVLNAQYGKRFQPFNLDFELGASKYAEPNGWTISLKQFNKGYRAEITDSIAKKGNYAAKFYTKESVSKEDYSVLVQTIDATPYRGRSIDFSAFLIANIDTSKGNVMLVVEVMSDTLGLISSFTTKGETIYSSDWKNFSLNANIPINASEINYGFALQGNGELYIDDVDINVKASPESDNTPEFALNPTNFEYLKTLSELYGLSRYNFPTNFSDTFDWDAFLTKSIESVLKAKNSNDFKNSLEQTFNVINPYVIFSNFQEKEPKLIDFDSKQEVFIKAHSSIFNQDIFNLGSKIININMPQRGIDGVAFQNINPDNFKGKKITISAIAKISVDNKYSSGNINIAYEKNGELFQVDTLSEPIKGSSWKKYTINTTVPDSATSMKFGLTFIGEGSVEFSNIEAKDQNGSILPIIKNSNFKDKIGEAPASWLLAVQSKSAGYKLKIIDGKDNYLSIYSDSSSRIIFPKKYYSIIESKASNLKIFAPIVASSDYKYIENTFENDNLNLISSKSKNFYPNIKDVYSRFAVILTANEILKRFEIIKSSSNRDSILFVALNSVANTNSEDTLKRALSKLFVGIEDGALNVWTNEEKEVFMVPFTWRFAEGKLIIKYSELENVNEGDEVLEINGKIAETYINNIKKTINGGSDSWKTMRALALVISGPKGEELNLKLKKTNGEIKSILTKKETSLSDFGEPRLKSFIEVAKETIYINLSGIEERAFAGKFEELSKAKRIIFDVRGGSLLKDLFFQSFVANKPIEKPVRKHPIYLFPSNDTINYHIEKGYLQVSKKVMPAERIFLIDEKTNGDIEYWISFLQNNKLATFIGMPSSGLAASPIAFRLPCNLNLSIARELIIGANGALLNDKAIIPDVKANYTIESIKNKKDDILEAAINYQAK